ncbi:MAG: hypothetical protein Q7J43_18395 [Pseudomonas sp.]|uniref:hypothetical protein n=1 Tax=Pseudomonas sp. TaxID=306 RepID=UPI002718A2B8|nr:hypothetical protein [Pseudomonas sp.]MDO9619642.1 hypothetical protein [Pseudomonas sp.]MDP2444449.1 hypothetical protein [Pseudomonas sp.]MDZ4333122.1 hypothetical protein [Pseudomonas sp.]
MRRLNRYLLLGAALLVGCSTQGERSIQEVAGSWSIRQFIQSSFALGKSSHYRVYHRGQLVRLTPPLVARETSELLAVGHFNPGVFPYPDLIVLVHDRFNNAQGYGDAKLRAFQLIAKQDSFEIVPIEISAAGF